VPLPWVVSYTANQKRRNLALMSKMIIEKVMVHTMYQTSKSHAAPFLAGSKSLAYL
jgi:hypothetical protein